MPMDRKKYPGNWNRISRRIRFERAGNQCEQCGAPNSTWIQRRRDDPYQWMAAAESGLNDWHDPIQVVLTVAHLNHDTRDNSDYNLKALCQRCHLVHDAEFHARNARRTRQQKKGLIDLFPGADDVDQHT